MCCGWEGNNGMEWMDDVEVVFALICTRSKETAVHVEHNFETFNCFSPFLPGVLNFLSFSSRRDGPHCLRTS